MESNGHNGVFGLEAGISQTRVVCNNTLQMAEKGASRLWRVAHIGDLQAKQKEAEKSLSLSLTYMDRIKEDAEKLALQKVKEEKFFREFFKKLNATESKKQYILENVGDIYKNKEDLQNFRGTAWGMYNAVCDFVSNDKKKRGISNAKMAGYMDGYPMIGLAQKVKALSNPDDLVLDPFMGSGTTAVAALLEGRRFVGAEIMENYYEISVERIKESYSFCYRH